MKETKFYDPTDGHYWTCAVPGGKTAVMWTHPAYDGWHVEVATFRAARRAQIYAEACNNDIAALEEGASDDKPEELIRAMPFDEEALAMPMTESLRIGSKKAKSA